MTALDNCLAALFAELVDGPSPNEAYMLNGGDVGLLVSLDRLSAEAASFTPSPGGASIAAHVDHVRYGLELMNRWSDGAADPWSSADWAMSWRHTSVTDADWNDLRQQLRIQARRWHEALRRPRDLSDVEMKGVVASVAHLAYHLGAIRQIDRTIQGPKAL